MLSLSSFLKNRQARVRFNESTSLSRKFPQGSVLAPLLFVLYIAGLNKIPEMSAKHRTDPTRGEKTNKLHSKIGRRHKANPTNIAEERTAMYADNVFILVTASPLTQAQKALQNEVSAVDTRVRNGKWTLTAQKANQPSLHCLMLS